MGSLGGVSSKESSCQWGRHKGYTFDIWIRKIRWRREWQATPVLLPGEFHGQRNLVGYSPWSHKESNRTEWLSTLFRVCLCVCVCVCVCVYESCSVMSDSLWLLGRSLPGFSVLGISQARVLEWVAIPFSRGSSQPKDQPQVSCIAGRFFTIEVSDNKPKFSLTGLTLYTPRKPELKETRISQCSLQHCLQ